MGSKTGLMRMSPQGVLVFTVKDGNWAVGLLSTTLSEELGLSQECVFFCSWDAATRERVTTTTPNNPLSAEAREQSLAVIKKTCFTSEAALFRHFQLIEARHASFATTGQRATSGTRIVLLHVDDTEHDIHAWQDIEIKTAGDSKWAHDRSMRSFCEVLYYCDGRDADDARSRSRHRRRAAQLGHLPLRAELRRRRRARRALHAARPRRRGGGRPRAVGGLRRAAASKAKSRIATEAAGGQPSGGGRQYEHGWIDLERGAPDKYEMATGQFATRRRCPTSCAR